MVPSSTPGLPLTPTTMRCHSCSSSTCVGAFFWIFAVAGDGHQPHPRTLPPGPVWPMARPIARPSCMHRSSSGASTLQAGVVPRLPTAEAPRRATACRYKAGGGEAIEASSMEVDAAILVKPEGGGSLEESSSMRTMAFNFFPFADVCLMRTQ
jgi:hypothetical protein